MEITPFRSEHIAEASLLFQKRYAKLRSRLSYLPPNPEKTDWVADKLSGIVESHPGFVAIQATQLVGYMIGFSAIQNLKGSQTGVYVPEWGNGSAAENSVGIYTELYKAISERWVALRNYTHIISFLANVDILETMPFLGFGLQLIDGGRDLSLPQAETKSAVVIENGSEKHLHQLHEIDRLINEHLEAAPCFVKRDHEIKGDDEIRKEFFSPGTITVVATEKDTVVSCIRGRMHHGNSAVLNHKNVFGINFGYTRKEYRNSKIATEVLSKIIAVAASENASMCSVDFESHNIEGRHFWLRHFSPIVYSYMRKIDDRL